MVFSYLNENVEVLDLQNENVWPKKEEEWEWFPVHAAFFIYLSFNFTLRFSSSLTVSDLTFHERVRLPFMTFHERRLTFLVQWGPKAQQSKTRKNYSANMTFPSLCGCAEFDGAQNEQLTVCMQFFIHVPRGWLSIRMMILALHFAIYITQ